MEIKLEAGLEKEAEIIVASEDTASSYGSGLLEVYATPAMVAFMENTAHSSLSEFISSAYTTVGVEINVKHLKATPIGGKLKCKSKLINIEGNRLTFEIQVKDEKNLVGEAKHIRYIVEIERFMKKLL